MQLLLLAREHAVDPALLACLKHLQQQVGRPQGQLNGRQVHLVDLRSTAAMCFAQQVASMPSRLCLHLLVALASGCSGHAALQKAADDLASSACKRLCKLLSASASSLDAESQQLLVAYVSPLQHMLNDELRRTVFEGIQFELLRVRFAWSCFLNY
jgi:hypothetical protein